MLMAHEDAFIRVEENEKPSMKHDHKRSKR
ncbi:hypothetical protein PBAL39_08040 [Pedobacter sp. BAL39]|nr:hypothetical protein PBAL39_08040 [Pedobacter sp. BAL39]